MLVPISSTVLTLFLPSPGPRCPVMLSVVRQHAVKTARLASLSSHDRRHDVLCSFLLLPPLRKIGCEVLPSLKFSQLEKSSLRERRALLLLLLSRPSSLVLCSRTHDHAAVSSPYDCIFGRQIFLLCEPCSKIWPSTR